MPGWRGVLRAALLAFALAAGGPAAGDDLEDILEGFEVEDPLEQQLELDRDEPIVEERWWELTGSLSLAGSLAYEDHDATNGTGYQGFSRLRTRLNLELDLDLPREWQLRIGGYVYYDFAYLIEGRSRFDDEVLSTYEWESDFQEAWIQGSPLPGLDLKIGRQIVNWGRSDNIRILDVLNPLDLREPGLVDIEDLRRPVGMVRAAYRIDRHWTLTGIAIPEIRFNTEASFGSEFYPAPQPPPLETTPDHFEHTEWAGSLAGVFQGWDVSFHVAHLYEDQARPQVVPVSPSTPLGLQLHHGRFLMVGSGGNYTRGSWLFKAESAWFDGINYFASEKRPRVDSMIGVEYYGFSPSTLAVEFAHRHILDFSGELRASPDLAQEDRFETSLRYTAEWMNARLTTTAVLLLFGEYAQDGSVLRLQGDYTIRDGLVATLGVVLYWEGEGDTAPLNRWLRNDRLFFELKYSF